MTERNPRHLINDADETPISCQYVQPGQELGSLTLPEGATGEVFHVRQPANSRQEAELEITLQRAKLNAFRFRASASVALDYSLWPPDRVRLPEVDRDWQIIGVTHQWPSGNNPEVTELRLQGAP